MPVRCAGAPPTGGALEQGGEIHLLRVDRDLVGLGQREQPGRDALELVQLVEDHRDVLVARGILLLSAQELGEAPGDRDRRTQLVGREADEPPLPLTGLALALRQPVGFGRRCHPPPDVPDHHQEEQCHQGDLARLLPSRVTVPGVQDQRHAGHDRHHDTGEPHLRQRPRPQPVDDRGAHPDEVERDGLGTGHDVHEQGVRTREHGPDREEQPLTR